jgi:hypothetical protein
MGASTKWVRKIELKENGREKINLGEMGKKNLI